MLEQPEPEQLTVAAGLPQPSSEVEAATGLARGRTSARCKPGTVGR